MKELTPLESWAQLQACPDTLFVDVRMEIEHLYVGHPPGVVHVAWYEYPTMTTDRDDFVRRVRREAGDRLDRPILLICRSGKRTVDAALTLEAAGFTDVAHVLPRLRGRTRRALPPRATQRLALRRPAVGADVAGTRRYCSALGMWPANSEWLNSMSCVSSSPFIAHTVSICAGIGRAYR